MFECQSTHTDCCESLLFTYIALSFCPPRWVSKTTLHPELPPNTRGRFRWLQSCKCSHWVQLFRWEECSGRSAITPTTISYLSIVNVTSGAGLYEVQSRSDHNSVPHDTRVSDQGSTVLVGSWICCSFRRWEVGERTCCRQLRVETFNGLSTGPEVGLHGETNERRWGWWWRWSRGGEAAVAAV